MIVHVDSKQPCPYALASILHSDPPVVLVHVGQSDTTFSVTPHGPFDFSARIFFCGHDAMPDHPAIECLWALEQKSLYVLWESL